MLKPMFENYDFQTCLLIGWQLQYTNIHQDNLIQPLESARNINSNIFSAHALENWLW